LGWEKKSLGGFTRGGRGKGKKERGEDFKKRTAERKNTVADPLHEEKVLGYESLESGKRARFVNRKAPGTSRSCWSR